MQEVDRTRRVAEVIKRELANLIAREVSDPRLRGVSINGVTVSRDLKNATVYVSSLENAAQESTAESTDGSVSGRNHKSVHQESVEKLLNNAAGYLRRLLGRNTDFRVTPTLRFRYDDSIQRGVEMSLLINSLIKKQDDSADDES